MTAMSGMVLKTSKDDPIFLHQTPAAASSGSALSVSGKSSKKSYKLRDASLKKRAEMEIRKNTPRKRGPKPRPKSAPMSKYRRKTANLRERLRMGEINVAFEKLRDKLPNPMASAGKAKCEKLTKINILHVAINYIRAMENLLETGDSGIASFSEMTKNPLRDESEKKAEMQRVLATLMQRADKVHHQARSKRRHYNADAQDESSSTENEELEEDEEDEENQELITEDDESSLNSQYIPPPADTSWTSIDSGIVCDPLLSTLETQQTHSSQQFQNSQQTLLASVKTSLNNNNDDIMKDFTDFVDLVDTLQGMPEIDFEDNFEMFP